MKTTKEEILNAALTVFAQKGYEGALLRDISASLGITKPALYKHFESKEALWNAMIDSAQRYYSEHIGLVSDIPIPDDWGEFRELSLRQINFTLHDKTVRCVRRLLMKEQFRDERIGTLATRHFVTDIEERFTKVFAGMMEKGLVKSSDPALLAFEYTAPVTVMIHYCDREPDKEPEIIKKIEAHIRQFTVDHKTT
ncbi:MAG: TetR/AcrR family transcriptional regulator [Oscillospiraceae bacterium]|nr:TetR/AcrR family transcriptional regulator [Oscillospiraceae bacterium]